MIDDLDCLGKFLPLFVRKSEFLCGEIIGFDNMPLSTSVIPALSTIHVPKQNLGKTAAERLINVIESDEYYSVKIEISATYIARKSVI